MPADVADDDGLLLVYTSGTTGKPKGAVLTHANCFWTNLAFDLATGLTGDDVVLQVLPQFHCGGWNVQPLLAWWKGGTVVLERGFEPARVLALLAEKKGDDAHGRARDLPLPVAGARLRRRRPSSLRLAVVGGAPMPEELLRTWQARGIEIVQGYGLTEAAPNVLCLPPEDAMRKAGSAGKPYAFVEARLGDGRRAAGARAERLRRLLAQSRRDGRGASRRLAAHRRRRRGRRGGVLPHPRPAQGDVHLRRRERLSSRGRERAAGASRPSPTWRSSACGRALGRGRRRVRRRRRARSSGDALVAHCRERLAKYKVPTRVRFVDALPMSAMNKVLKDELRALDVQEVSA